MLELEHRGKMRTEFSMDSVHEKHMVAARDRKHIGFINYFLKRTHGKL